MVAALLTLLPDPCNVAIRYTIMNTENQIIVFEFSQSTRLLIPNSTLSTEPEETFSLTRHYRRNSEPEIFFDLTRTLILRTTISDLID
jgi:hypothetical protein